VEGDRCCAVNFAAAVQAAGVRRIIYLGGLVILTMACPLTFAAFRTWEVFSATPASLPSSSAPPYHPRAAAEADCLGTGPMRSGASRWKPRPTGKRSGTGQATPRIRDASRESKRPESGVEIRKQAYNPVQLGDAQRRSDALAGAGKP